MATPEQELTEAYREERALYREVLDRVDEQQEIMDHDPNPARVLKLCQEVESLLEDVAGIEQRIDPIKEQWEHSGNQRPEQLDRILEEIQQMIEQTAGKQDRVRRELIDYVRKHQQKPTRSPTTNAHQARRAYGA